MKNLIKMLRQHEGVKSTVYLDTVGIETIGVGRNLKDVGLSDDEIDYLLVNDINRCKAEAKTFNWYEDLNTVRREAILNLLFNLGKPRFLGFKKAIEALEANDYEESANQFWDSKWRKQVGSRAEDICLMIRTGKYPYGFE